MTTRRATLVAALALLGSTVSGCGWVSQAPRQLPINHFLSDPRDFDTVRRVMILPFNETHDVQSSSDPLREAFLNELVKIQRFEVVPLPSVASEHEEIHTSLVRGKLSTDALVTLSQRYQIDGVLIGTVSSYRPYPPMRLGLRVQLVSLHSGRTVWAAEGLFDANDARTREDLQHYAETFAAAEASLHGWELNLIAPSKFAHYVAHRLTGTCRPR